jgi:hypothetical protein
MNLYVLDTQRCLCRRQRLEDTCIVRCAAERCRSQQQRSSRGREFLCARFNRLVHRVRAVCCFTASWNRLRRQPVRRTDTSLGENTICRGYLHQMHTPLTLLWDRPFVATGRALKFNSRFFGHGKQLSKEKSVLKFQNNELGGLIRMALS